jgi:hypothetical protein
MPIARRQETVYDARSPRGVEANAMPLKFVDLWNAYPTAPTKDQLFRNLAKIT